MESSINSCSWIFTRLSSCCDESSINSFFCCEGPSMTAKETKPRKGRIEEENADKEIMEADLADAGIMINPQLPSSQLSFLAEKGRDNKTGIGKSDKKMGAVWGTTTIIRLYQKPKAKAQPMPVIFPRQKYSSDRPAGACRCNDNTFGSLEERTQTLDQVMEALAHPNTHIMGLHCSNKNAIKVTDTLLERITRRAERDNMFDVISKTTVTKKRDVKKIQHEIACSLGLKLDEKSTSKRAILLDDSIKKKQKILVILCELYKGIDLGKVGIPYGTDHTGCKILLTSTSEEVLSNQMHTQKNFRV